ncbi:MAG: hypothetical protein MUF18_16935 [Fimbriiglobus sp.]|jgi:hypothetical protein|nr:hypothetical protein [Fimbriiglobus sp.]
MPSARTLALTALVASGVASAADPRPLYAPAPSVTQKNPTATATKQPSLMDFVAEAHRDTVGGVVRAATLSAKSTEEEFVAHPAVYDWLLDHPDRTSLGWQRMKVPCVDIVDRGKGQFTWADETGSELHWQTVGDIPNGRIWYATGKVKPAALLPMIPVKAVAVLQAPRSAPNKDGYCTFKPVVNVYLQCDSRLANAALRIAGPSAPKMAEEGAGQLLYFFSGVAKHLEKHPDQVETMLAPKPTATKKK